MLILTFQDSDFNLVPPMLRFHHRQATFFFLCRVLLTAAEGRSKQCCSFTHTQLLLLLEWVIIQIYDLQLSNYTVAAIIITEFTVALMHARYSLDVLKLGLWKLAATVCLVCYCHRSNSDVNSRMLVSCTETCDYMLHVYYPPELYEVNC